MSSPMLLEELDELADRSIAAAPQESGRLQSVYVNLKSIVERIVGLGVLLLAMPMIVICAVIVKWTSPGPAFYSQTRVGLRGKTFRMHKIRSMPHNCEAATGPVWSTPDDPRVTRFGRFLRDTHLDELPQLLNVVTGDMSLIGPRPERPEMIGRIERSLPRYRERLQVKPGMTGLAQMQLPPDSNLASVRRKLAYDLQYVHEIGPWLDVRILMSTVLYCVGHFATALCRELTKSDRHAAEHRVDSIEIVEEEVCEIGTR